MINHISVILRNSLLIHPCHLTWCYGPGQYCAEKKQRGKLRWSVINRCILLFVNPWVMFAFTVCTSEQISLISLTYDWTVSLLISNRLLALASGAMQLLMILIFFCTALLYISPSLQFRGNTTLFTGLHLFDSSLVAAYFTYRSYINCGVL